mmetsp:Transcript_117888/g.328386  ORF Transcript_117888/g.328386 Transcript_117888/m.328386 type:complete len:253 (-) Transcript_117888:465-1223(-)
MQIEAALQLLLIIDIVNLPVSIDLDALRLQFFDVVLPDLTELATLVVNGRVLPGYLLGLVVHVVESLQVLVPMLLPAFRQLHSQVQRLHLFDVIVDLESNLVTLGVLIPLHDNRLLAIHPLCSLALQSADVDLGPVGNFTLRHFLVLIDVAFLHCRVHEVLLAQLHHDGVVAAALEFHLVPVHLGVKIDNAHNLPVVIWLVLQANDLHKLAYLELCFLQFGGRLAHTRCKDVVLGIGLLQLAVLLDFAGLLG